MVEEEDDEEVPLLFVVLLLLAYDDETLEVNLQFWGGTFTRIGTKDWLGAESPVLITEKRSTSSSDSLKSVNSSQILNRSLLKPKVCTATFCPRYTSVTW